MFRDNRVVLLTCCDSWDRLELLYEYVKREYAVIDEWRVYPSEEFRGDVNFRAFADSMNDLLSIGFVLGLDFDCGGVVKWESGTLYVRVDDNIVWLEDGWLGKMLGYVLENPRFGVVYGNLVNSALTSHLHQRFGVLDTSRGICVYDVLDPVGHGSGGFGEWCHRSFLEDLHSHTLVEYYWGEWLLFPGEGNFGGFSAWSGDGDIVGLPGCLYGGVLACNYASLPQRPHMASTDLLRVYRELMGLGVVHALGEPVEPLPSEPFEEPAIDVPVAEPLGDGVVGEPDVPRVGIEEYWGRGRYDMMSLGRYGGMQMGREMVGQNMELERCRSFLRGVRDRADALRAEIDAFLAGGH